MPRLKYYYTALEPDQYHEFLTLRQLRVGDPVRIDITTGQVLPSRQFILLAGRAELADTRYRQLQPWPHELYVLRIPHTAVPRRLLTRLDDPEPMWLCTTSLDIPTCGVDRFDLAPEQLTTRVLARSGP